MKFLIWFLCIFASSLISTCLKAAGVMLGAIPTIILFGAAMWLARTLCKNWDEHKETVKLAKSHSVSVETTVSQPSSANSPTSQPVQQNTVTDQICFCRKCGSKLMDDATFCNKCGTEVVKL